MARVHFVKKARKDNPCCKKGESYYWWQFAFMAKQYSKTKPTRSQTTRSPFYSQVYDIEDSIIAGIDHPDNIEDATSEIENLKDETECSLDNMPDGLRDADTGMLLQERIDNLETWIDELDSLASEYGDIDDHEGEERKVKLQDFKDDLSQCGYPE